MTLSRLRPSKGYRNCSVVGHDGIRKSPASHPLHTVQSITCADHFVRTRPTPATSHLLLIAESAARAFCAEGFIVCFSQRSAFCGIICGVVFGGVTAERWLIAGSLRKEMERLVHVATVVRIRSHFR